MPLDPEVVAFLETWNRNAGPSLTEQPVARSRELMQAMAQLSPSCPAMRQVEDVHIDGPGGPLRIRITIPQQREHAGAVVYLHGGGWVINSIETHDDLVRRLSEAAACPFFSVDYRLAPEHPYPAAADDTYAALCWLQTHAGRWDIDPARIAIAGDSAGANLAIAACLMARDRQTPLPAAQVLAYPVTDCDFETPSYRELATGHFLTRSEMIWFWDQYCPDHVRRLEPYASPLRAASLAGLPPSYVITAEYDPLRDEGERFAAALATAGVPLEQVRVPGMIHAYLRRTEIFAAARASVVGIGQFLRRTLGADATL